MLYDEINEMTEAQAQEKAVKTATIKGHNVYFIDFEDHFGYGVAVFRNNHHIYYANDYALHHPGKSEDELTELFTKSLNNKLYTDQELIEPIKDYDDYTAKMYFLRNYHPMQKDRLSMFVIIHNEDEDREYERKKAGMIMNPVGYCYNDKSDADFVKTEIDLLNKLESRRDELNDNYDYYKSAFLHEMYNHEYGINHYQANYDTLSAFGNVEWHGDNDDPEDYFKDLGFTETQKRAYYDARREYYKRESENLY